MTVAFDAFSTLNDFETGESWTHTPVGVPTAVGVWVYYSTQFAVVTGVTYGASNMGAALQSGTDSANSSNSGTLQLYGLASPPSGPQTVTVLGSGSFIVLAAAVSVTGSDLTTCFRDTALANNGGVPAGVSSLAASLASQSGDLCVDLSGEFASTAAMTPGTPNTTLWGPLTNALPMACQGSSATATGATTMNWAYTGSQFAGVAAGAFKAASGASCTPTGTLLGVEKCLLLAPLAKIIERRNRLMVRR